MVGDLERCPRGTIEGQVEKSEKLPLAREVWQKTSSSIRIMPTESTEPEGRQLAEENYKRERRHRGNTIAEVAG